MVRENSGENFRNGDVQSDLETRGPEPADIFEARQSAEQQGALAVITVDLINTAPDDPTSRPGENNTNTQDDERKTLRFEAAVGWMNWSRWGVGNSDAESREGVMVQGGSDDEFSGAEGSLKTVNQAVSGMPNHRHCVHFRSIRSNTLCLLLAALLLPAGVAAVWLGMVPIEGAGHALNEAALWMFVINPGVQVALSFTVTYMFLGCLGEKPWEHLKQYAPVLVANYIAQVSIISAAVHANKGAFRFLGLSASALSIAVTLIGLRVMPMTHRFGRNESKFMTRFHDLLGLMAAFVTFYCILIGYIITSQRCTGTEQGLLTIALSVLTFVWKAMLVRLTNSWHVEMAVLIVGLWLENLADVFISLGLVTITQLTPTFALVLGARVFEDIRYIVLGSSTACSLFDWLRRKCGWDSSGCSFEENARFLAWKLVSQLSSIIVFLSVVPLLRFGRNRVYYPFRVNPDTHADGMISSSAFKAFNEDNFEKSMLFSGAQLAVFFTLALSAAGWMVRHQRQVVSTKTNAFRFYVFPDTDFRLMLAILVSNVLLGVSAFQVPNKLYFL